jgi:hypothetical protein
MREWFRTLDADEQERRREFARKFKADYDAFRALPLGTARHISEHRTGVAPVTVTVTGDFGLTYKGVRPNQSPRQSERNAAGTRLDAKTSAGSTDVDRFRD